MYLHMQAHKRTLIVFSDVYVFRKLHTSSISGCKAVLK